jgi:hypothetical protein
MAIIHFALLFPFQNTFQYMYIFAFNFIPVSITSKLQQIIRIFREQTPILQ